MSDGTPTTLSRAQLTERQRLEAGGYRGGDQQRQQRWHPEEGGRELEAGSREATDEGALSRRGHRAEAHDGPLQHRAGREGHA